MGKATNEELRGLLSGWSDSEFAVAASGEFTEDLKSVIEGVLARDADLIGDLLAALKALVAPSDPMRPTEVRPLVMAAHQAIAKAEQP